MPASAPAIVITQHMPPGFTTSFAARLNGLCQITVQEAENGARILPGHCLHRSGWQTVSGGQSGANYVCVVEDAGAVNRHKPSVGSCSSLVTAKVVGRNALGVMLTGMGNDGAKAMKEMRDAGSYTSCRTKPVASFWHAARSHLAQRHGEILPLREIAAALLAFGTGQLNRPLPDLIDWRSSAR